MCISAASSQKAIFWMNCWKVVSLLELVGFSHSVSTHLFIFVWGLSACKKVPVAAQYEQSYVSLWESCGKLFQNTAWKPEDPGPNSLVKLKWCDLEPWALLVSFPLRLFILEGALLEIGPMTFVLNYTLRPFLRWSFVKSLNYLSWVWIWNPLASTSQSAWIIAEGTTPSSSNLFLEKVPLMRNTWKSCSMATQWWAI